MKRFDFIHDCTQSDMFIDEELDWFFTNLCEMDEDSTKSLESEEHPQQNPKG